jgi:SAM-dependent methyltransferase
MTPHLRLSGAAGGTSPHASAWACPLCGSPSRRRFARHGIWVRDCTQCAHRFAEVVPAPDHVDAMYGDAYFEGGGAGYADYRRAAVLLREQGRRYGEIVARHRAPGRMLDVGAAAGFMLQGFHDAGWAGCGIEPNARMARFAREQLALDVACGIAEDIRSGQAFDLVAMIQVMAHFADPVQVLSKVAAATAPDGWWLIETWDCTSLSARVLGRRWHEYSPPTVLHWFSRARLTALVERFGLRVVAHGRPVKRLLGAHAKSLLHYKLRAMRGGRFVAPALRLIRDDWQLRYPAEDVFWILCRREGAGATRDQGAVARRRTDSR